MPAKIHWTEELLKTRVCRNLHVGEWVKRSRGEVVCRGCQRESVKNFREAKGVLNPRPRKNLSVESLRNQVAKLEEALATTRKKLELMEELEKIQSKLKDLH